MTLRHNMAFLVAKKLLWVYNEKKYWDESKFVSFFSEENHETGFEKNHH